MNHKSLSFLLLLAVLFTFSAVSADSLRENPSFYSVAEIVQRLPKMWMANRIEVMEMMKEYPDFTCLSGGDTIGCHSVNNKNCAFIHLDLRFTSEEEYAEFDYVSFIMEIDDTEEVQKAVEAFWLPGMRAANISGADYSEDQVTIYFNTDDTLMKYSIHFSKEGVWLLRTDIGFVRG